MEDFICITNYSCLLYTSVTKNGKPYESVILQDKTGTIDAKVWEPNNPGIGDYDDLDYIEAVSYTHLSTRYWDWSWVRMIIWKNLLIQRNWWPAPKQSSDVISPPDVYKRQTLPSLSVPMGYCALLR